MRLQLTSGPEKQTFVEAAKKFNKNDQNSYLLPYSCCIKGTSELADLNEVC